MLNLSPFRATLVAAAMTALAGCQAVQNASYNAEQINGANDTFVTTNDPDRVADEQFARGNYAMAERYYRDAVERKPGDIDSWIGLGASYDQLKRFDLADRAYIQARKIGGTSARLLNNEGYSLMLRGKFREAESKLRQARALDPNDPVINNNLTLLADARAKYGR